MSIFDSFDVYKLVLIAIFFSTLITFIHRCLCVSPYSPIFERYRSESFTFYVKKNVMRILLRYRKKIPIKDDDADKLQPLSSHPLVSNRKSFNSLRDSYM